MNQPAKDNSNVADIVTLTRNWAATKANLTKAQELHLQSEIAIYNAVKDQLSVKGTTTLETGLKIVTGMSEKWSQTQLEQIALTWDAPVPFPFKSEFKPDSKQLGYIRDNLPALWKQLQEVLTLADKKPAFSMKE